MSRALEASTSALQFANLFGRLGRSVRMNSHTHTHTKKEDSSEKGN